MGRFKMRMQWKKWAGLLVFCLSANNLTAQIAGGQRAMEYLRLPNSPHISALGGINIAMPTDDISFAIQNPSLMRPGLHNQLGLVYNNYYAGIDIMNLQYGYHAENINTSFVFGLQYINYGTFTQTDDIGNIYGDFRAVDYSISLGASRSYGDHWRYGGALKFAQSGLWDKNAMAVLADVGVNYYDTSSFLNIGIVAKNMGTMVKKYKPGTAEPLPFDLQIGISKRFKHIPLRLMGTIHHLYEWDIRYDDPALETQSNLLGTADSNTKQKSYFADKLFRHFIFAAELTFAKRVTATVAYNHLRRGELTLQDVKGAAGFSFGLGIHLNKFQVHYARSYYHIAGAYNEFGLNMTLNKLFGIGKFGEKVNWSTQYPDWQF